MIDKHQAKIISHGHELRYKILNPSEETINLGVALQPLRKKEFYVKEMKLNDAIYKSEDFMKGNFRLHLIKTTTAEKLNHVLATTDFVKDEDYFEALRGIVTELDPYNLPIIPTEIEGDVSGALQEIGFDIYDEELIKKLPIVYMNILIDKNISELTPSIITHEIAHSQVDPQKGITKSYYNSEVLTTFLELVSSLEQGEEIARIKKEIRLSDLADLIECATLTEEDIPFKDIIEITKYLQSTIKALNLYDIYVNSSVTEQRQMLDFIQKIFDGEKLVEELLDKYNVDLNRGVKQLKKTYL